MKVLISVVVLTFIVAAFAADKGEGHMSCAPFVNGSMYHLNSIRQTTSDYILYQDDAKTQWIQWNLCDFMLTKCDNRSAYAGIFTRDDENNVTTCKPLTDDQILQNIEYRALNNSVGKEGVSILFRRGSVDSALNESFTLNIVCNASLNSSNPPVMEKPIQDGTNTIVTIQSASGCAKLKVSDMYEFIRNNKYLFFVIAFCVGALICFMGYRLSQPVLFLLGFCIAFLPVTYVLFTMLVDGTTTATTKYVYMGISIAIGLLVGYLAYSLEKVGFFIVGACIAFSVTQILNVAIFIHLSTNNTVLFGLCWVVLALIIGMFMVSYKDTILIIATSLFGSWLMVRSAFNAFYELQNEFAFVERAKMGQSIPLAYWIFLGVWFAVMSLGLYTQFKHKSQQEMERKAVPDYLEM